MTDGHNGRLGARTYIQDPQRKQQVPIVLDSVGSGYVMHLHPVDIPRSRVERRVGGSADQESTFVHRVRGYDGRCGGFGTQHLSSGILL